jgi:hypothetical protein
MNRTRRLTSMVFLLAVSLLLLPASAQETTPPVATGKPAATETPATTEKPAAPAEEADAPPDLGENVSADNSVSFPVDI